MMESAHGFVCLAATARTSAQQVMKSICKGSLPNATYQSKAENGQAMCQVSWLNSTRTAYVWA